MHHFFAVKSLEHSLRFHKIFNLFLVIRIRLYALTDIFALNIHTQTTPLKIKLGESYNLHGLYGTVNWKL